MTADEYRAIYPPPSDPRQRRAYEAALTAMLAGDIEWGPPPEVEPEHDGRGTWHGLMHGTDRRKFSRGGKHADKKQPYEREKFRNQYDQREAWRNTVRGFEEEEE